MREHGSRPHDGSHSSLITAPQPKMTSPLTLIESKSRDAATPATSSSLCFRVSSLHDLLFAKVSNMVGLGSVLGASVLQYAVSRLQRCSRLAGLELDLDGSAWERVVVDNHARLPRNLSSFDPIVHTGQQTTKLSCLMAVGMEARLARDVHCLQQDGDCDASCIPRLDSIEGHVAAVGCCPTRGVAAQSKLSAKGWTRRGRGTSEPGGRFQ